MVQKLENIEACVFDAYGTLFDVAASSRHCAADIGDNWLNFSALWRKKQLEYTWLRSMMGRYHDFWHVTGEALDFTMDTFNMKDPALRARLMELYLKLDAYPEVKRMLENLKDRGIKTAILSNGSRTMLTSAVRQAGIYDSLDAVLSVDDVGIFKIDPRVYQMAVDQMGVKAENIAFQSANSWDAAGATVFGFQVVWVNRFGQKPEKLGQDAIPQCEIKSLHKLPELIDNGL
ncbi:(S)-2-haloacid dehalogenase 1 [Candidatus Terasakiella magnetica]|uniref:(S)-2-haloacid dehalogenase n=1 Tax=Candidatus Terasakiella magnetica TaxID=1867952 RepID=A0A1C3RCS3_9PROT|nr:haloacid dehalogenase type II [Candidatus Terasakiella magnetica]SCA55075.1 (S)-2-haloacid dehalogenase 1 [Candidatus Terasakiella magnetica]